MKFNLKKIAENVVKTTGNSMLNTSLSNMTDTAIRTAQKVSEASRKSKTFRQVSDFTDNAIKKTGKAIDTIVKSNEAKKTAQTVICTNRLGKIASDTFETINESKKKKRAQQELNFTIERARRLNDITQKDLNDFGETKAEILSSFSTFCDYMEKIQQRPEIKDIKCNDFILPPITIANIEEASLNAKDIILKVAKKQFSWQSIAMIGGVGIASTIATTLAVSAFPIFSISLVAKGIFSLGQDNKEDIWELIEENQSKANKIIKRLTEIDYAITEYLDTIARVQGYYNVKLEQIAEIFSKYKSKYHTSQISWMNLDENERLIIQNCTLLVGLLYEMCKVQLLRVDKANEEISVNKSVKTRMINKAENVIKQAA